MKKLLKAFAKFILFGFIALIGLLFLLEALFSFLGYDPYSRVSQDITKQNFPASDSPALAGCLKQINPGLSFSSGLFFKKGRGEKITGFELSDDVCVFVKFDLEHNGQSWEIQRMYR